MAAQVLFVKKMKCEREARKTGSRHCTFLTLFKQGGCLAIFLIQKRYATFLMVNRPTIYYSIQQNWPEPISKEQTLFVKVCACLLLYCLLMNIEIFMEIFSKNLINLPNIAKCMKSHDLLIAYTISFNGKLLFLVLDDIRADLPEHTGYHHQKTLAACMTTI